MSAALVSAPSVQPDGDNTGVDWVVSVPFFLMHLAPLGACWTGVTAFDLLLCLGLYYLRMFFITAGYHRYFAHRSYKMGRVMQFIFALGGGLAAQKGVLWWAANHRHHHKYSDQDEDLHSPRHGFWWSHVGWVLCERYSETRYDLIQDMAKYPELRWLNRFHLVPAILLGVSVFVFFGASALFIGFFLSTVLSYHGTFIVNSLAHVIGKKRYETGDDSKNSALVAFLTMGEGWHNNHHYYQSSARQGFFWWEFDFSYYILKALSWFGLVSDLREPPKRVLGRQTDQPRPRPNRPVHRGTTWAPADLGLETMGKIPLKRSLSPSLRERA